METKEKQKRQTFRTQEEREECTRIRKRQNKRDQRKRDKEKAQKEIAEKLKNKKWTPIVSSFRQWYRWNFYLGLRYKSFNKFVTLTCKDTVSLNWLISKSKSFIGDVKNSGILGNYFLVFEHDGGNYHVHILMSVSDGDKLNDLTNSWKYGNTKIVDVIDQKSREAHICYCTKQFNPDNHNPNNQRLIDSWDMDLVEERYQSVKSALLDHQLLPAQIDLPVTDTVDSVPKDLPMPIITCSWSATGIKKIAYHFLLWLVITCLCFYGLKAI